LTVCHRDFYGAAQTEDSSFAENPIMFSRIALAATFLLALTATARADLAPDPTDPASPYFWLGGVIIAAAAAGFLIYRRRRK
jgi:LPXTG-motif cell wall-anchored protein